MVSRNMFTDGAEAHDDAVESHNEVVPTQGATTLMALIMNKRYMVMLMHLIARLLVMM
jgi:hypothetical protein